MKVLFTPFVVLICIGIGFVLGSYRNYSDYGALQSAYAQLEEQVNAGIDAEVLYHETLAQYNYAYDQLAEDLEDAHNQLVDEYKEECNEPEVVHEVTVNMPLSYFELWMEYQQLSNREQHLAAELQICESHSF